MTKAVATEQRQHPRLTPSIIRAEVERDGKRLPGYIMNVSLGGAFLSVEEPPPPNSTSQLLILLPWGFGECRVQALSVWQQIDDEERPIGAGVSFVELSEDAREKIRMYLERNVELAAEITG